MVDAVLAVAIDYGNRQQFGTHLVPYGTVINYQIELGFCCKGLFC